MQPPEGEITTVSPSNMYKLDLRLKRPVYTGLVICRYLLIENIWINRAVVHMNGATASHSGPISLKQMNLSLYNIHLCD